MSTALSVHNESPPAHVAIAITQAMEQLKAIRTFVGAQFREGLDFGKIPGCGDKPTLLLPGAQKATMYFNCRPSFRIRKTNLGDGHCDILIRCILISRATREEAGEGVGSCSTMEKKYRWRDGGGICPKCGKPAVFKSKDRPEFYCWKKKDGCGAKWSADAPSMKGMDSGHSIENPDLWDLHNTILKMAKKRAHVDAAMTLGCLSELFTQDIEDIYESRQVREAASHREGEVEPESAPPVAQNNSGFGRGSYASPVQLTEYSEWLSGQCEKINRKWHKQWKEKLLLAQENGYAVPEKISDVISTWQANGHLLKWALDAGFLDHSIVPEETKSKQAAQYVAILYHRSDETFGSLKAEMASYLQKQRQVQSDKIYRDCPDLAPDGWAEEQAEALGTGDDIEPETPHGEAYEGQEGGA